MRWDCLLVLGIMLCMNEVFAVIFIVEMVIKLIALGLIWGPDAYLKSSWNWLDGIVVTVSIVNMAAWPCDLRCRSTGELQRRGLSEDAAHPT